MFNAFVNQEKRTINVLINKMSLWKREVNVGYSRDYVVKSEFVNCVGWVVSQFNKVNHAGGVSEKENKSVKWKCKRIWG